LLPIPPRSRVAKSKVFPEAWMALLLVIFWTACSSETKSPESPPGTAVKISTVAEKPNRKASHGANQAVRHSPANRLADETSPYLLMHAHNPVDWYPWGPEAFAKAQRENKLIFLSIGYSSCYWCHVMERESFMDKEIAAFLNKHFVCIKVDREERPDVDDIYMTAVQLITRRGGWPLSVFLTPDAQPAFGGTYFPARQGDRGSQAGFLELITAVEQAWEREPETMVKQAERLSSAVATVLLEQREGPPVAPTASMVDHVQEAMEEDFDKDYGGFGQPPFQAHNPKFPSPPELLYLVDRIRRNDDPEAREMLLVTLDKMAEGGLRDHLGGGFHRYSVDRFWHIPHFEKMLYDNGQLASVYAEAFALTGKDKYRRIAEELLDFVLREMTDQAGGFYSAIDAETDAEEGKYYRWEKEELESLLDEKQREFMGPIYSFSAEPNFRHDGQAFYVPQLSAPIEQLAAAHQLDEATLENRLTPLRERLLAARSERKRPLTDTKILTAWNGLMIRGFADAGRIFNNERYLQAATRGATFTLDRLQTEDGRLLRSYRNGSSQLNAYLVDYAFLVDGLIALYRATQNPRWLEEARTLTDKQIELFWDEQAGGFFFTSDDHETLIARAKKRTDNVLPSGNGIAATNLVYLANALPDSHYGDYANRLLGSLSAGLQDKIQSRRMPTTAIATAAWLDLQDKKNNGPRQDAQKVSP
jgi:uncharacterized protein YyaL (SSP411 family)